MRISFIVPKNHEQENLIPENDSRVFPPLGLAKMTSIAAAGHRVRYLDERLGKVCHDPQIDIAIIFINNYNRQRAYLLATNYRAWDCFVVFTGAVLEKSPEDAHTMADCLFIGAGEEILPEFLQDFSKGRKRRLYGSMLNPIRSNEPSALRLVS